MINIKTIILNCNTDFKVSYFLDLFRKYKHSKKAQLRFFSR